MTAPATPTPQQTVEQRIASWNERLVQFPLYLWRRAVPGTHGWNVIQVDKDNPSQIELIQVLLSAKGRVELRGPFTSAIAVYLELSEIHGEIDAEAKARLLATAQWTDTHPEPMWTFPTAVAPSNAEFRAIYERDCSHSWSKPPQAPHANP